MFQPQTPSGYDLLAACEIGGITAMLKFKHESKRWSAAEVVTQGLSTLAEVRAAVVELRELTPEQRIKVFGFDPAELTKEQVIEGKRAVGKRGAHHHE